VKLLIDTHLLLWASDFPHKLPKDAAALLAGPDNDLFFSSASIWEVATKGASGRRDFAFDPDKLRRDLLNNGYLELSITSAHAAAVRNLPPIHRDPFDRILVAQATVERITLLTTDRKVARYPGPIRKV
jgi:PIN domain nuclease of toxin-antitoxin system